MPLCLLIPHPPGRVGKTRTHPPATELQQASPFLHQVSARVSMFYFWPFSLQEKRPPQALRLPSPRLVDVLLPNTSRDSLIVFKVQVSRHVACAYLPYGSKSAAAPPVKNMSDPGGQARGLLTVIYFYTPRLEDVFPTSPLSSIFDCTVCTSRQQLTLTAPAATPSPSLCLAPPSAALSHNSRLPPPLSAALPLLALSEPNLRTNSRSLSCPLLFC